MVIRLGELLVAKGVLTEAQRIEILEEQRTCARPFGELAERLFGIHESVIEQAWAEQYASMAEAFDPTSTRIEPHVLALVHRRQAWQFCILPVAVEDGELIVCTTPQNLPRALRFMGWSWRGACSFRIAPAKALCDALTTHYPIAGLGVEALAG